MPQATGVFLLTMCISSCPQVTLLMVTSNMIIHHVTKDLKLVFMNMTFPVTGSESSRTSLGCCRMPDLQYEYRHGLHDAVKSTWTRIPKQSFQHPVESIPWRIGTVLRANGASLCSRYSPNSLYTSSVPNKVLGWCKCSPIMIPIFQAMYYFHVLFTLFTILSGIIPSWA